MSQTARHLLVILAVAVVVFFTNLGGPRLWDRDEPRNARCAVEMLERGDWVVPYFNGQVRDHKPVLLYWLMMAAYAVFGVNEFSARFWSAVLAMGTVVCTYLMGRRLFNAQAGQWAAVVLSTTLMFDVAARAATPDSPLIFFSTAALTVFVLGTFRRQELLKSTEQPHDAPTAESHFPTSLITVVAMYGLMGVAVLAKGPVGLVMPCAVIGMFLLIVRLPRRESTRPDTLYARIAWYARGLLRPFGPGHFLRTCLVMRPLLAVGTVLAVALPWYVWVAMRDFRWIEGFFLVHNLGRATTAMEGHHGPLFYYIGAILVGTFPWSVFAGPVLIDLWRRMQVRGELRRRLTFACCWVGVYVVLFSLASTKLPSYVTPCYPGIALIVGLFVERWLRGRARVAELWPRLSMISLAVIGLGMTIALPLVAAHYLPGEELLGLIGLVPLAAGGLGLLLLRFGRRKQTAGLFAAAAVALATLLCAYAAQRVDSHQRNDVLLAAIDRHGDSPRVVAYGALEPTWVYYGERPVEYLGAGDPEPAARELTQQDDAFAICTRRHYEKLKERLPADFDVLAASPYFMRSGELVVVGRQREKPLKFRTAERPETRRR